MASRVWSSTYRAEGDEGVLFVVERAEIRRRLHRAASDRAGAGHFEKHGAGGDSQDPVRAGSVYRPIWSLPDWSIP
jgi:hypothetical protein